jgi:hypothetical protein
MRQRCPLSLHLFILAVDVLGYMLDLKYIIRGLSLPSGIITYNQSFTSNTIFFFERWVGGERIWRWWWARPSINIQLVYCSLLEPNHHIVTWYGVGRRQDQKLKPYGTLPIILGGMGVINLTSETQALFAWLLVKVLTPRLKLWKSLVWWRIANF